MEPTSSCHGSARRAVSSRFRNIRPFAVALATLTVAAWAGAAHAADQCIACHAKLERLELSAPVAASSADVHGKAGVTCSQCHGGDATATKGSLAHGIGFVARPEGEAVAAMCGGCHRPERDNWEKSPHALAADAQRRPSCVTCHGSHEVKPASADLIAEPLCTSCHSIAQPRRIWRALNETEQSIAALDAELDGVPNLAGLAERLRATRGDLRGVSHSMNLMALTRKAAASQALVEDLRAKAGPRLQGRRWGRTVRRVSLWFLAVLGGLAMLAALARLVRRTRVGASLAGWLTPRRWGRGVLALLGALCVAGTLFGWRGYEYVQHSPNFCISCHTMDSAFGAWAQSGHKNVECHTCHRPDVASNLRQLWLYATERPGEVVKHAEVNRAVCETCHNAKESPAKWNAIMTTSGHKVHAGAQAVSCVQCHATSIHHFRPPEQVCNDCHKGVTLAAAGGMGELHCLQCHNFLADGQRPLRPDRSCASSATRPSTAPSRRSPGTPVSPSTTRGKQGRPDDVGVQQVPQPAPEAEADLRGLFQVPQGCGRRVSRARIAAHKPGTTECIACHRPHTWKADKKRARSVTRARCPSSPRSEGGYFFRDRT